MKSVKALIVDDSLLFREILHQELERDINIKVVAKATDAFDAGHKITEFSPDVLIVDVIMDRLNGVDFIKQLLPQYYAPVIMVSSDASKRKAAEEIQGVTFIQKPADNELRSTSVFFALILDKIRTLLSNERFDPRRVQSFHNKLIAVGASTGGAEALETILTELPASMPPIVIAQHMPPKFTSSFAERLNTKCRLSIKEAEDGEVIIPGQVYIAPGGQHMAIRSRNNRLSVQCTQNVSASPVCPNIDTLLSSMAALPKQAMLGVLLTGMGKDGAAGLKLMRDAGAFTIGQDEATSVVYGMPKAAFDMGAVDTQLALRKIPKRIIEWAHPI